MAPYSPDIRRKIFIYSLTHSIRKTAEVFSVSPNTVYLLKKLFTETGNLVPHKPGCMHARKITEEGEFFLMLLLATDVDLTLSELCDRYADVFDVRVEITTMHETLKRLGITRKRKTFYDPKKDTDEIKIKVEEYEKAIVAIPHEERRYLDETGSCLNMSLDYGWSLSGYRVYDGKPTSQGTHVSTVAILSEHGFESCFSRTGYFDSKSFAMYLDTYVLPGWDFNNTLILDNSPVHASKVVMKYMDDNNIKYLFTPPYSPEYNPIEHAWSKIKQFIKKQKSRTLTALFDTIKLAEGIVTERDVIGYFAHVI